jgi:hypothetical protein
VSYAYSARAFARPAEGLRQPAWHSLSPVTRDYLRSAAFLGLSQDVSWIIPGDWGKAGPGWLVRPLEGADRKASAGEAAFTSSSGDRRGSPVTRIRNLAARRDKKPCRAGSSSPDWFRVRANRSYPEGIRLLLCASTVDGAWAVPRGTGRSKAVERRTMMACHREGHGV